MSAFFIDDARLDRLMKDLDSAKWIYSTFATEKERSYRPYIDYTDRVFYAFKTPRWLGQFTSRDFDPFDGWILDNKNGRVYGPPGELIERLTEIAKARGKPYQENADGLVFE